MALDLSQDSPQSSNCEFGREFKRKPLNYSDLGSDCHVLRIDDNEESSDDDSKFENYKNLMALVNNKMALKLKRLSEKKCKSSKKEQLTPTNTISRTPPLQKQTSNNAIALDNLKRKREKIMKAMQALHPSPNPVDIEVIDLTSDIETSLEQPSKRIEPPSKKIEPKVEPSAQKTLAVQPIVQQPLIQQSHVQPTISPQIKMSSKNIHPKNAGTKRKKRPSVSDSDMDTGSSYEPCVKCRKQKRSLRKRKEAKIDSRSSDSLSTTQPKNKRSKYTYSKYSKQFKYSPPLIDSYESHPPSCTDGPFSEKTFHDVEEAFGDFRCRVCNVQVHSEVTLQTHLVGKKHLKALKAQAVPEVAKQSLSQFSSKPPSCVDMNSKHPFEEEEHRHYPPPAPGMTRVKMKKIAKLQTVADSYRKHPITGLSHIIEIHLPSEVIYYCELCDANCAPITIMHHLIGFKHKLNFFKRKFPIMYERFQYKHKKQIEYDLMKLLVDYDKTHGRGLIKVEEEIKVSHLRRRHRRFSGLGNMNCRRSYCEEKSELNYLGQTPFKGPEDLDLSLNDFYCKVCDSHMNNEMMWEAHVRGRRHLKNKKKRPGENPSKIKNIYCPGEKAKLMSDLRGVLDPIVGLNYIQEVQGSAGNQYKCFLCGACCTSFDIIDHIISEKHRTKLLETEHQKGKENGIEQILELMDLSNESRRNLIAEEASRFQSEFGKGKILVYKSKDILPSYY